MPVVTSSEAVVQDRAICSERRIDLGQSAMIMKSIE